MWLNRILKVSKRLFLISGDTKRHMNHVLT